jgi:hypothetical protein
MKPQNLAPNDELLQYCQSSQQAECYAQLLQKTNELLKAENDQNLQVRPDLQALLRQKVAANQQLVHHKSLSNPLFLPKKTILNLYGQGKTTFWQSAAAVAAVWLCILFGHFMPSNLSNTVVAQDTLSMQQGDTMLKLDSQVVKVSYSDSIR